MKDAVLFYVVRLYRFSTVYESDSDVDSVSVSFSFPAPNSSG